MKEIQEKVTYIGKYMWFIRQSMLKVRVIDREIVGELGMKELKEMLDF